MQPTGDDEFWRSEAKKYITQFRCTYLAENIGGRCVGNHVKSDV